MGNEGPFTPSELIGGVSFSHKECFGMFDCVTAGMPLLQRLACVCVGWTTSLCQIF